MKYNNFMYLHKIILRHAIVLILLTKLFKSSIIVCLLALMMSFVIFSLVSVTLFYLFITKAINNNSTPLNGPVNCPWTLNNCGPNDEPFSFHTGGAMAVFGDGSVRMVRDSTDVVIVRGLVSMAGSETIDPSSY
jgi:prepilin-type processing-associated H-X9-DG protein